MLQGNYVLILHTHLPWVLHHGAGPHGVDWLNEAVAECYLPLLNGMNELLKEGIKPKITFDISPVLCEQLEHTDFKEIFIKYCDEKIHAAKSDESDFRNKGYDPHHIWLATYWAEWYTNRKSDFIHKYDKSIIGGLKELQDAGAIEIMTCAATHGYLPLLGYDKSINLQIKTAVENYKKHFGRAPRGIWLPECAYRPTYEWHSYLPVEPFHSKRLRPGIEQFLSFHDIKYFVTDEKLLKESRPLGTFLDHNKENFVPLSSPSFVHKPWNFDKSPMRLYEVASDEKTEYGSATAFVRHHDISMQVWSGQVGYPGQPDYLDFHKKHLASMLRYWRVTDNKADMMYKTLYHPDWTRDKIDHQSMHFINIIENSLGYYKNITGITGSLTTPFDTELFGHWWFEGPDFIKSLIRGLHNSPYVNMVTASEEYFRTQPEQVISIPEGSWGVNNNHDVWSNDNNKWTWEMIYNDELRLSKLYDKINFSQISMFRKRIITQALKELMLMHSSDWQFLIYTESARDYAEQRFAFHHSDFNRLCDLFEKSGYDSAITENDEKYLSDTEARNSIFPELQPEWWQDMKHTV